MRKLTVALAAALLLTGCDLKIPNVIVLRDDVTSDPRPANLTPTSAPGSALISDPTVAAPRNVPVVLNGRFVGIAKRPIVGYCRLTGSKDFDHRVMEAVTRLYSSAGPELEGTAKPDADGVYTLAALDQGHESEAIIFFAWDDANGDGVYTGIRPGHVIEPLGQVYVYWRTPQAIGFNESYRGLPVDPHHATFTL